MPLKEKSYDNNENSLDGDGHKYQAILANAWLFQKLLWNKFTFIGFQPQAET